MDIVFDITISWALGLLGAAFYILKHVWSKIAAEGFNPRKFFADNKWFWLVGITLHLIISILVKVEPDIAHLVNTVGIAIEDSRGGFIFLGYFLASGTNKALPKKVQQSK